MSKSPEPYLRHILDEIDFLIANSERVDKNRFLVDAVLKRAFVRSIEIIGEATKHLPSELTQEYPKINWRAIAGTRDKLIHAYFGIDYEIVWNILVNEIPELKIAIERMLASVVDYHQNR